VRSRDRAWITIQELDRQQALEYGMWCEKQEALARSGSKLLPFKPPTAVERQWLQQYAIVARVDEAETPDASFAFSAARGGAPRLRRYKTLVYDGPSRTGKSERAAQWFTEARTLKLNCQGVDCPNMRPFLGGAYEAVLCEETTWEIMWKNRQLFQAGPWRVQLGQSPCNEHCYSVWCWGVPFMICSNDFWQNCANATARAWVEANIAYVKWDTPTWHEHAIAAATGGA